MTIRNFICIVLLVLFRWLNAQTDEVARLEKKTYQTDTPTEKADICYRLAYYLFQTDSQKAVHYFHIAEQSASKEVYSNRAWKAVALGEQNLLFLDKQNALEYFEQAKKDFLQGLDWVNYGFAVYKIAETKVELGQFPEALRLLRDAFPIFLVFNETKLMILAANQYALVYSEIGQNDKALEYWLKAVDWAEKIASKPDLGYLYNNIAYIYKENKSYDAALNYYHRAFEINLKENDVSAISLNLGQMAMIFLAQGKEDSAESYLKNSLQYANQSGLPNYQTTAYSRFGEYFIQTMQYNKALSYYQNALTIAQKSHYEEKVASISIKIAQIYFQLQQLQDAEVILKEWTPKLEKNENYKLLLHAYELQYKIATQHNDIEKAAKSLRLVNQLQSDNQKRQNQEEFQKIQTSFNIEKDIQLQKQLANEAFLKAKMEQNQTNFIIYLIIITFFVILLLIYFILNQQKMPAFVINTTAFVLILFIFEFILLLVDPYKENYVQNSPWLLFLFNIATAALLSPLHAFLKKRLFKNSRT